MLAASYVRLLEAASATRGCITRKMCVLPSGRSGVELHIDASLPQGLASVPRQREIIRPRTAPIGLRRQFRSPTGLHSIYTNPHGVTGPDLNGPVWLGRGQPYAPRPEHRMEGEKCR